MKIERIKDVVEEYKLKSTVMIAIKIHHLNLIRFQNINLTKMNANREINMKISGRNELINTLKRCLLDPKRLSYVLSIKQS